MSVVIYSFYNNKGGVGKTTLCQNAAALYAEKNRNKQVLVIDLCPQANISQFMLGGGRKGYDQNQKIQSQSTRKNIVGFIDWLLDVNSKFTSTNGQSYKIQVSEYNKNIASNLFLIAGDSFLESLLLALNYKLLDPDQSAWGRYMTAISRLCKLELKLDRGNKQYDDMVVFIDLNPSFSVCTQMGLVSSNYIITPMMADYSSLDGIRGLLMLLYGKYPSAALKKYYENRVTFNQKIEELKLPLPKMYQFVFNNFTTNLGVAAAYGSVRDELIKFCKEQFDGFPDLFAKTNSSINDSSDWSKQYLSNVKDFHSAGKVSAALGIPVHKLEIRKYDMPDGKTVQLSEEQCQKACEQLHSFVDTIN